MIRTKSDEVKNPNSPNTLHTMIATSKPTQFMVKWFSLLPFSQDTIFYNHQTNQSPCVGLDPTPSRVLDHMLWDMSKVFPDLRKLPFGHGLVLYFLGHPT